MDAVIKQHQMYCKHEPGGHLNQWTHPGWDLPNSPLNLNFLTAIILIIQRRDNWTGYRICTSFLHPEQGLNYHQLIYGLIHYKERHIVWINPYWDIKLILIVTELLTKLYIKKIARCHHRIPELNLLWRHLWEIQRCGSDADKIQFLQEQIFHSVKLS